MSGISTFSEERESIKRKTEFISTDIKDGKDYKYWDELVEKY